MSYVACFGDVVVAIVDKTGCLLFVGYYWYHWLFGVYLMCATIWNLQDCVCCLLFVVGMYAVSVNFIIYYRELVVLERNHCGRIFLFFRDQFGVCILND